MLEFDGAALIGEVIAAAWLVIALIGFSIRRTRPWLICVVFAGLTLFTAVVVIADAAST